ncbi:hypothetical protein LX69_01451 [Breznakibacter xylanolyticus]|uniref:Methyltransferase type 11 domain-containing protein n=1 Tax=Breznakibacter xylanolyticus TaxID=990 RepID=A0A2W7P1S4_9BACT|nr:class I SAM-dependent methyltransferase [Breznakibacter xylanolyticus]PZX17402.1 hypothetical protein LX69_01451 [Breznakibacter xylanolyticus]
MSIPSAAQPSIQLEGTIPLGRNIREYELMFNLWSMRDTVTYLDCGAGPASFNAEMTVRGRRVVSVDPLYELCRADLAERVESALPGIIAQVSAARHLYRWDMHGSPERLSQSRGESAQHFLADYDQGRHDGRYVAASLPQLPFADESFDVAVCSHLLFLYSKVFDAGFHIDAIRELLRVATEVRIFPLCDLNGEVSPHLREVVKTLRKERCHTQIINVPYEFQRGVNQCLLIRKKRSL